MNRITKETAMLRFKKALQHKRDIQQTIEQEFAATCKNNLEI